MKAYGNEMKNARCPYSDAELNREIRKVIWRTERGERREENECIQGETSHLRGRRWLQCAALVAAIVIPVAIFTSKGDTTGQIASVNIDGEQIYFACNNGCAVDQTIETFKTLLR